jgi:hypothetical protein
MLHLHHTGQNLFSISFYIRVVSGGYDYHLDQVSTGNILENNGQYEVKGTVAIINILITA